MIRNLLTANKILILKCCEFHQLVFFLRIMSHTRDFCLNKSIVRKKEDIEDSDKGNNFQKFIESTVELAFKEGMAKLSAIHTEIPCFYDTQPPYGK
ncbi:hypothetical protein CDAR_576931 [Caerostris darwini]|uniref:Uncharacterized protein n=1 Tax=Caerostris darwini TaxID=1538125 RepID=A0AAV4RJJ3_9ARAC|nr:hypothetical protein CDAR_576931 [Caerostris darwini]